MIKNENDMRRILIIKITDILHTLYYHRAIAQNTGMYDQLEMHNLLNSATEDALLLLFSTMAITLKRKQLNFFSYKWNKKHESIIDMYEQWLIRHKEIQMMAE